MIEGVTSDFFEAIFSCSDMPPGGKVAKRPARAGTLAPSTGLAAWLPAKGKALA